MRTSPLLWPGLEPSPTTPWSEPVKVNACGQGNPHACETVFRPLCVYGQHLPKPNGSGRVSAEGPHGSDRPSGLGRLCGHAQFSYRSPADERSQEHARRRGYDLSELRARQITTDDFDRHDLILVMNGDNLALVEDVCPPLHLPRVRRLTGFCLISDNPVVPDPYYGGAQGFDHVLDLVEDACEGLLKHVRRNGSG